MVRALFAAVMMCAPIAAMAADDYKIAQLEQDVRDLQRQVLLQARQIEELRALLARPAERPPVPTSRAAGKTSGTWIDASKWQQIQVGMNELEVVSALGPPTSMRATENERVLLYAMEIGTSGFLSGSVTLRDRVVVEVQKPVLR